MADPSRYARVKRVAEYVAKVTNKKYVAKKTTKQYREGQRVSLSYVERYPQLVRQVGVQKGKKVSQAYAKRYPHLVRKLEYMIFEQRELKYDKQLKHQTYGKWVKTARERLTHYEAILPLTKMSDRRISTALARNKVYHNIWQNVRGVIRVTVSGLYDGRRVKEIIHIGYLKRLWYDKHNGYKQFKQDLLHKVLNSLRRRRLRLSNPKESKLRIKELQKKLDAASHNLSVVPDWMQEQQLRKIKSLTRSIREQRRSHQLLGGTIRIEKLVS